MTSLRFLTGITTSGTPHLGNYVGSIRPSVQASLRADDLRIYDRVVELAQENNITPLIEAVEAILVQLSNRDAVGFDEKYVIFGHFDRAKFISPLIISEMNFVICQTPSPTPSLLSHCQNVARKTLWPEHQVQRGFPLHQNTIESRPTNPLVVRPRLSPGAAANATAGAESVLARCR